MPNLLLYEDLPLRSTRMLGDYAEDAPLPHLLGDLTGTRFPLLRLSDRRFFAADHAADITAVYVDRERTDSWEAVVTADSLGHTVTVVELGAPAADNVSVSASGRGARNPDTGEVIGNPGELLAYVAALAGRADEFQALRQECSAAGILLAGRLAVRKSIRATYDEIMQSAGAIWCPGMSRRYPTATVEGAVLELGKMAAGIESVTATIQDTADVLRLRFDVDDASGRSRQYVELSASPQRFGGLAKELTFAWIRSAAVAVQVGGPILQRLAGERYTVTASTGEPEAKPGRWVRFVDHPEWPIPGADPEVMILGASATAGAGTVHIEGEALLTAPTVTVTAHSVALPDTSEGALEVSERDGVVTFTVYDAERHTVAGARVSLNGGPPKTTDEQGQVSFLYTPGQYEVAIEAPGRISQTLIITL